MNAPLIDTYERLGTEGTESINEHMCVVFENVIDAEEQGKDLFLRKTTDVLKDRKLIEDYYYYYIKNGLMSKLMEIKSYSAVNIFDTRRLIYTNIDCISSVHVIIRDKIYLNVYFRSSDYKGALPSDLEFLTSIPRWLIEQLTILQHDYRYSEINDESIYKLNNMNVELNISFGSLH